MTPRPDSDPVSVGMQALEVLTMRESAYLGSRARSNPDKPAVINASSDQVLSYRELDERSNRLAQWLYGQGLRRGDHMAVVLENNLRYFEVCWAALRSGLGVTPISRFLTPDEAAYIVADSQSQVVVSSYAMRDLASALTERMPGCRCRLVVDGPVVGWASYEEAIDSQPCEPLAQEWAGWIMLYSSGTTGRPKGIVRAEPQGLIDQGLEPTWVASRRIFDVSPDMVYLSTAPLYHAAPLTFSLATQFFGGTVVFVDKFDAAGSLAVIERYRVTHSQWVPTMFVRLLKLPDAERKAHDLSSHRVAIHAAAPCPVEVKHRMIDWWGPILREYYGASEGIGNTYIDSADWLAHPGSVGRTTGAALHICDDQGLELPPGEIGLIYFENPSPPFHYHNDPDKTRAAQHPLHSTWHTAGDIGYVDSQGYLYLTDRRSFMIISGGVNIYPQAIEDALALHPSVADVAVIGVPSQEMGEDVKAVVEAAAGAEPSEALALELIDFLRDKVARYMLPRSVDFVDRLPRSPTGKLFKSALRERYWPAVRDSR